MSSVINPLLNFAQAACDKLFELKTFSEPSTSSHDHPNQKPKLVAHRGAWDHNRILENTMPAFREAQRLGAWGIEFDVRFTKDDAAVICHDQNLKRCFNQNEDVCDLDADKLPAGVCHLDEVLALKDLHFMIEIKEKLNITRLQILERKLRHLTPISDYHLLALHPDLVAITASTPAKSWILVGELKTRLLIRYSIEQNLGGVAGHYALVTKSKVEALHKAGQTAGTGFLPTKNLLNREWRRGVDWVFTNDLQNLV